MAGRPELEQLIREKIIADPEALLADRDVMRALAGADHGQTTGNVVDIRGLAIDRLEERLDRLEDTHRSVIAAAYDNLAGTNQVHRAVLAMLEPVEFDAFLTNLTENVADALRVDAVRLVLESAQPDIDDTQSKLGDVLFVAEPGFVSEYVGAEARKRQVVMRQTRAREDRLFGERAPWIRSEVCMQLNLGPGRSPGMLVLASEDPHMFNPKQGTDLLVFFAGSFERSLRRWLG